MENETTQEQSRYRSHGFKLVKAETMNEAAQVFATRAARRKHGRMAVARTCNQQARAVDGSFAEYEAFIGRETMGGCTGSNIHFTVREVRAG